MTPPWAVLSPTRAAGLWPIQTVPEPAVIASDGPAHVATSPTQAAGRPPISTERAPGLCGSARSDLRSAGTLPAAPDVPAGGAGHRPRGRVHSAVTGVQLAAGCR